MAEITYPCGCSASGIPPLPSECPHCTPKSDKVVYLRKSLSKEQGPISTFDTPEKGSLTVLGCSNCANKTFALVYPGDTFPKLQCCVCGQSHGHMGWVDHETD